MAARDSTRVKPHTCLFCGGVFTPVKLLSRIGGKRYAAYSGAKTCSMACEKLHMKTFEAKRILCIKQKSTGPKSASWKGGTSSLYRGYHGQEWQKIAEKARKRDKHQCQRCLKTQADLSSTLHVHHRVPAANFTDRKAANRMSNLVTLCASCHCAVEKTVGYVQMPLQLHPIKSGHGHGGHCKGSRVSGAKLNDGAVQLLRQEYCSGKTTRFIAKKYGLSQASAWAAINGHTWSHLKVPDYSKRVATKPGPKTEIKSIT